MRVLWRQWSWVRNSSTTSSSLSCPPPPPPTHLCLWTEDDTFTSHRHHTFRFDEYICNKILSIWWYVASCFVLLGRYIGTVSSLIAPHTTTHRDNYQRIEHTPSTLLSVRRWANHTFIYYAYEHMYPTPASQCRWTSCLRIVLIETNSWNYVILNTELLNLIYISPPSSMLSIESRGVSKHSLLASLTVQLSTLNWEIHNTHTKLCIRQLAGW